MAAIHYRYQFTHSDGQTDDFSVHLDSQSLLIDQPLPEPLPDWTRLSHHQCDHCPLDPSEHSHCPLAARLVHINEQLSGLVSHEPVVVEVQTPERLVRKETTAQQGISALMGLLIPGSGCPHTRFFRPMARFHLPFASEEETIYRAATMYLLAQYFIGRDGGEPDLDMAGLDRIYRDVQKVNDHIARRLRDASQSDSTVNAVVLLDMFARTLPFVIEESVEELRHLFRPFLKQPLEC
jgi:hypothetical protein